MVLYRAINLAILYLNIRGSSLVNCESTNGALPSNFVRLWAHSIKKLGMIMNLCERQSCFT
jgi:hypothetical protein